MWSASSSAAEVVALRTPYGASRYRASDLYTYGFTGQRSDDTTSGLDYYGARYYDPLIGQFTSADTDARGGLNRYGYVADDPETLTDPSGHRVCNMDGSSCSSKVGGGSGGSGGDPVGGKGTGGGCTTNCGSKPKPVGKNDNGGQRGGAELAGYCVLLPWALAHRIDFLRDWFNTFAYGMGQSVIDFVNWIISSGRMAGSAFWRGVDGDLIGDMWVAAVFFEAGTRHTSDGLIQNWLSFMAHPTTDGWWHAHNASTIAAATSPQGLIWFHQESRFEQLFINDVLVNLIIGTDMTSFAGDHGVHTCDPGSGCVGLFIHLYPGYPAPWWWFLTSFGEDDTEVACAVALFRGVC